MSKSIKAYVYDNKALSRGQTPDFTADTPVSELISYHERPKLVRHVTGETYIYHKGTARRVICDAEGKVLGVPRKLTKKQRRKIVAQEKVNEQSLPS